MSEAILLADDNVTIQRVVELALPQPDYQVVAVSNGNDAVDRLRAQRPGLVIADVHMPGFNGYEVARQTKELHPSVPVLLMVGTFEPFSEEEYRGCGADALLRKPFDAQELVQRVTILLLARQGRAAMAGTVASVPPPPLPLEPLARPLLRAVQQPGPAPASAMPDPYRPPTGIPGAAVIGRLIQPMEAAPPPPPVTSMAPAAVAAPPHTSGELSSEQVDRIARRVVELIGEGPLREVAWQIMPDLAEVIIKERLRELETQVEES